MIAPTVSFKMAKRLDEAGWPHTSACRQWYSDDGNLVMLYEKFDPSSCYAAPILTELLEALPKCLVSYGCDVSGGQWSVQVNSERTRCVFSEYKLSYTETMLFQFESRNNPCDAAAKLWLWCKKKGYLK